MSDPGVDYFLDNYGTCRHEPCRCRDPKRSLFGGAWVGRLCPSWVPSGITSFRDLQLAARALMGYEDTAQRTSPDGENHG